MQPPLDQFRKCLQLASDLTSSASPTSEQKSALDSQLTIIDDVLDALPTTDILYHHINAVSTASAAISCIAAEDPLDQLKHVSAEADASIKALKEMNDSSHAQLAEAVEEVISALRRYMEKNVTKPISVSESTTSSPTAVASETSAVSNAPCRDTDTHTAAHLVDYRTNVIDGAANPLLDSAAKLGGEIHEQARNIHGAVDAVYEFLVAASQMPKPPSDEKKQDMLQSIIAFMSAAGEMGNRCTNRDPHFNHVKALEEAVNMVSWIVATEKPMTFISDADGSASFYLNKLLMATKKQSTAADHKAFVDSLKSLFKASKAFVKEHYTMGMRYGNGIAGTTGAKKEEVDITDESVEEEKNYVTAFKELLDGPLASFVEASKVLGGEVEEQANAFQSAWNAEHEFLSKAMGMPKPDDFQDMLSPVATEMGKVGTIAEKCGPRGAFANHCSAIGESVGILGWVAVDEKAVSFVGDMADASQFFVNKVKMGAKNTDNPEAHRKWASALETLYKELKAYVKEYHTQRLTWNPPKAARATPLSSSIGGDDEIDSVKDYVTAFRELLSGPLAAFIEASKKIGGEVEEQSKPFAAAWEAEADFLSKAIGMPKPEDVQSLLGPIAEKMGEVGAVTTGADPRGQLINHCNSVSESIQALGWVAVDEKPVSFVSDMAGTGQFYLNKVRTAAKNMEHPEFHREWATCLETLYKDLKGYVKEYHTQKLVWNPPKTRRAPATATLSSEVSASSTSDYVTSFKDLVSGPLSEFVQASESLGGDVHRQAKVFAEAWEAEAEFLEKAIKMKKPSDFQDMLTPIATKMGQVNAIAEEIGPRASQANHCNAVGEYVAALGWVAVDEKATSYVGDMSGAGEFYTHKVKMEAKKTDSPDDHRRWATALEQLFKGLKLYVKEHHTQRLTWNKV